MLSFLKNHPFAVEAFFENSLVLTYCVPKEELENRIPECLMLDTFEDKWAFVAVAMVQTKNLRPKGFPKFMGNNFFLIGYRIFVRYINQAGKRLRGLYILKSETNKRKMQFLGNIFTHYKYETIDIQYINKKNNIQVSSKKSNFEVEVNWEKSEIELPLHSPFKDWKEARRFAGPLPFTFTYQKEKKEVLIIEGVREDWIPKPVQVIKQDIDFIKNLGVKEYHLANAFLVQNIPYYWKKGKKEKWNK